MEMLNSDDDFGLGLADRVYEEASSHDLYHFM